IKDKLFIYVNAEQTEREGGGTTASRTASQSGRNWVDYDYKFPRWLAKVDWHITDNHMLEFTGVSDVTKYDERGYEFDYDTLSRVGERPGGTLERDDSKLYIGKYTGYLTDNLALSALYGRQQIDHTNSPFNYDPNCPRISAPAAARAPGLEYTT